MRRLSFVLAVILTLTFLLNLNRIFDYEVVADSEQTSPIETPPYTDPVEDAGGEVFGGLRSIEDYIVTGNLDGNSISFTAPVDKEEGTSEEIGDEKKIFFFGKPTDVAEGEDDWDSDWSSVDDYEYTSPSTNNENNLGSGIGLEPIEVTFDRFLRGE